jgi:serine/threonine protein kinase
MATVFLAHDLRHKRPVALKVLHEDLAPTLGPERFQREIETVARLQHLGNRATLFAGSGDSPLSNEWRDEAAKVARLAAFQALRFWIHNGSPVTAK